MGSAGNYAIPLRGGVRDCGGYVGPRGLMGGRVLERLYPVLEFRSCSPLRSAPHPRVPGSYFSRDGGSGSSHPESSPADPREANLSLGAPPARPPPRPEAAEAELTLAPSTRLLPPFEPIRCTKHEGLHGDLIALDNRRLYALQLAALERCREAQSLRFSDSEFGLC